MGLKWCDAVLGGEGVGIRLMEFQAFRLSGFQVFRFSGFQVFRFFVVLWFCGFVVPNLEVLYVTSVDVSRFFTTSTFLRIFGGTRS